MVLNPSIARSTVPGPSEAQPALSTEARLRHSTRPI
jgi:hypothetical protein